MGWEEILGRHPVGFLEITPKGACGKIGGKSPGGIIPSPKRFAQKVFPRFPPQNLFRTLAPSENVCSKKEVLSLRVFCGFFVVVPPQKILPPEKKSFHHPGKRIFLRRKPFPKPLFSPKPKFCERNPRLKSPLGKGGKKRGKRAPFPETAVKKRGKKFGDNKPRGFFRV